MPVPLCDRLKRFGGELSYRGSVSRRPGGTGNAEAHSRVADQFLAQGDELFRLLEDCRQTASRFLIECSIQEVFDPPAVRCGRCAQPLSDRRHRQPHEPSLFSDPEIRHGQQLLPWSRNGSCQANLNRLPPSLSQREIDQRQAPDAGHRIEAPPSI